MPKNQPSFFGSWNKWHFVTTAALLYGLVVLVAMFTHQPPEVMDMIVNKGAGGVGLLIVLVLLFA